MKNEVSSYLENISLLLLGITLLSFPLVFSTLTTDSFTLPKQLLAGVAAISTLLLYGVKTVSDRKVIFRRTPFDVPLFLFALAVLVSALLSVNRYDALIAVVPFLFVVILFFTITNAAKNESGVLFLLSSLILGGTLSSVLAILTSINVYILPFVIAKTPTFTTFGSLLDQTIYFALLAPIALYLAVPMTKNKRKIGPKEIALGLGTLILLAGLSISLYKLFNLNVTNGGILLLPFQTGFQTGFAAISQDAGRLWQGFFFGSGFGTFSTVFTRFKPVSFNLNEMLWSFTFLRSSSFVLELLATTGVLGLMSYVFIAGKFIRDGVIKKHGTNNPFLIAVTLTIFISLLIPFTFIVQALFFVLLALYATHQAQHYPHKYFDVELDFVALKKGIFVTSSNENPRSRFLPVLLFLVVLTLSIFLGFYTTVYALADTAFQRSLIAAGENKNNGIETYNLQTNAIRLFPYRDGFHRVYSQTNLALANSIAASVQKEANSTPSAEIQQTITTLTQQSINAGRNATTLSPLTSVNWQNLSSVYRSIIGFGENAESFAVLASQQAIALDPNNPQGYLNLGGIYFQLGQFDEAVRQFQVAINIKPNLANARYNLGHALEQKGDLPNALAQYKTVKTLVANDKKSVESIDKEIAALEAKIGSAEEQASTDVSPVSGEQPPLGVNEPATKLPEREPQVKIPGPATKPLPSPTPTN